MIKATKLLSAAFVLTLAVSGWAADAKVYSGHMCVEENDTTPEVDYQFDGSARNSSGSSYNKFFCPIVRDNSGAIDDIHFTVKRVANGHQTDGWDIEFWSMAEDGLSGCNDVLAVTTGAGTKTVDSTDNICSSDPDGAAWVATNVPAGASINRYKINEI